MTSRARSALLVAIAALCCAALHLPGVSGPFLLDDLGSITGARPGGFSFAELLDIALRDPAGFLRRPIATVSFALNHLATRSDPFGFKLVNIAIHALVVIAAYVLARRLLAIIVPSMDERRARYASLVGAVVYGAHPLQVSTVLYVVQRMTELATLFSFLALAVFAGALARGAGDAPFPPSRRWLALAAYVALTTLAVLSKENGVLVPVLALATLWCAAPAVRDAANRSFLWLAIGVPLVLGAIAAAAMMPKFLAGYAARDFTLGERLLTEAHALWFYVRLIAWPNPADMGLYHDGYPIARVDAWTSYVPVFGWLAACALAFALRRRVPLAAFAIAWFIGSHLLESTFIGLELVFEHRNYLALFGPALFVGSLVAPLASREPALRLLPLLVVLPLAGLTLQRSHTWSSELLFNAHELAAHPDSPRARTAAASIALRAGAFDEAAAHVAHIRKVRPTAGWPMLLDAQIACNAPGHRVDWAGLERHFGGPRIDSADLGNLQALAERFLDPATCPHLDAAPLQSLLAVALERQRAVGHRGRVEEILVLSSYPARGRGDHDEAARLLRDAADANPRGTIALFDLALLQLNGGRLDEVPDTLERLRAVARAEGLPIGYQIDELEGFLAEARTERGTR